MERESHAYKLSRCMCPSSYNRFWDRATYLWKIYRHFITPPCIRLPRRNIFTPLSWKKLEWCRYATVKKFRRYIYSFWRDPRTWQTDGQTDTAWQQRPRLCIASRRKKSSFLPTPVFIFCFPWRRPCDYHAICCMDGKTIQCLPNPSQHVSICLQ